MAVLVLSAMPGVAYLSTTVVYAVGGKEKNKVFNPRTTSATLTRV